LKIAWIKEAFKKLELLNIVNHFIEVKLCEKKSEKKNRVMETTRGNLRKQKCGGPQFVDNTSTIWRERTFWGGIEG